MSGRDITEGRAARSIALEVGIGAGALWQNSDVQYDFAIGGLPFLAAIDDQHPYERATAPFRKQQFDTLRDPGEQSLTGWWIRSQSSFHTGEGIKFFDPFANQWSTTLSSNSYRVSNTLGVDIWTQGQVTLLNRLNKTQNTTAGKKVFGVSNGTDGLVIHDDGQLFYTDGSTSAMTTIATGTTTIFSACTDGLTVYFVDQGHFKKVAATGGAVTTLYNSGSVTSALVGWTKQRLIGCVNASIYELSPTGTGALPTAIYTHPNTTWTWTGIAEAGPAIYVSGYNGANSGIYKLTLDSTGAVNHISGGAVMAAMMPENEIINAIYSYLGTYIAIGTSKGVRIGSIDANTGDITYGPLLNNNGKPVYGFAAKDSFVYCATSVVDDVGDNYVGCIRVDLSNPIEGLRFPYANDLYAEDIVGAAADVAFLGLSDRVALIGASVSGSTLTGNLGLWIESTGEKYPSGWVQTGYIRYNTLEQKNFKRVVARGDFGIPASGVVLGTTRGSMTISTRDLNGNLYDVISYDNIIGTPEATITAPNGAQDALGLRFTLYRDATVNSTSPVFKGYQMKSVPASPRSRIIKVPLFCFDTESDKYNNTLGYEGRAYDRLAALEHLEEIGDILSFQDFRTGETNQCLIEEVAFVNATPPDKRLTGYGGIITLTVRTV